MAKVADALAARKVAHLLLADFHVTNELFSIKDTSRIVAAFQEIASILGDSHEVTQIAELVFRPPPDPSSQV